MKRLTLLPVLMLCFAAMQAQHLQVEGKFLEDASGHRIILRGINYPLMDDGNVDLDDPATYRTKIDEFVKTGANCIRIPWNTGGVHWRDKPEYGGTPGTMQRYIAEGKLGELIGYCYEQELLVILEIHDLTCQNDWARFDEVVADFWLDGDVLQLIHTYSPGLILNIVNEFGYDDDWGGNMQTFKDKYAAAVHALRGAGIDVPVMIDAPNCGTASSALTGIADELLAVDDNLIFSVHTYWTAYAPTPAEIDAKMQAMQASAGCFVLGEIANKQDVGNCGDTDITPVYKRVLTNACSMEMGWLAWSYHKDCTPDREMTSDGSFAGLTAYGNDLVHNPDYGLKSSGPCSGNAGRSTGIGVPESLRRRVLPYPNPGNGTFFLNTGDQAREVQAFDAMGALVPLKKTGPDQYELVHRRPGLYWLRGMLKDGTRFEGTISCRP